MKRTAADLSGSQCSYDKLSYKDLQDRCRERGLATTGRVDDLVVRLLGDDAQQSDALCTVAKVSQELDSYSSFSFGWGIDGFERLPQTVGQYLRSASITAPGTAEHWALLLYPRGCESGQWVSVFLEYSAQSVVDCRFSISLFLDHKAKDPVACRTACYEFGRPDRYKDLGWRCYFLRDELLGLMKEGNHRLCIHVHIETFGRPRLSKPQVTDHEHLPELGQALYHDCEHTDIAFVVGGQRIPAHKSVLAAGSAVFGAMFRHDMQEKATGQIDLPGFSVPAAVELKRFMYTGAAENLSQIGCEVMELAVLYELPRLQELCTRALQASLSESNVCHVFTTAHLHSVPNLKDSAARYMCRHPKVLKSAVWRDHFSNQPDLLPAFHEACDKVCSRAGVKDCPW